MIDPCARIRRVELDDDTVADPLDAIARAPGEPAFYWRSDARGVEVAALGAVAVVDAGGADRFECASSSLAALAASIDQGDVDPGLPLAVGGFAFDDEEPAAPWQGFPALRFFVPRVLWFRRDGRRRMVVTYAAARGQTPRELLVAAPCEAATGFGGTRAAAEEDGAHWRARVGAAMESIRRGEIEKVVLARRRTVVPAQTPCVESLLGGLADARPSCFTFLVRWSGRTFLGSSPERLARLSRGVVEADALAGTAPRGLSRQHDEALARELLASAKERREHRIVADAIRDALGPVCDAVELDDDPSVRTLPEAHHLHTPVRAVLRADDGSTPPTMLDVARRLHPTPAVCGAPREAAMRRLASEEAERGWYGGAVGWTATNGDGELAVSLRAALLDGASAHVWAGAGIVEGSDPEHEYDETERKMRSILPWFEGRRAECAA